MLSNYSVYYVNNSGLNSPFATDCLVVDNHNLLDSADAMQAFFLLASEHDQFVARKDFSSQESASTFALMQVGLKIRCNY